MIEIIPREKAESLDSYIPSVRSVVLSSPEESTFILLTVDDVLNTTFDLAIYAYGEIIYLSNEKYRKAVSDFLTQYNL